MKPEHLVQRLGEAIGIPALKLSAFDSCAFVFAADQIHFELRYLEYPGVFNLCLGVTKFEAPVRIKLMQAMLLFNLNLSRLSGCHFAFREADNEVVLCRTISAATLSETQWLNVIEQCLVTARKYRVLLQDI